MPKSNAQKVACSSVELSATNGRVQLFPYGRFYPADNRPEGVKGWYVDDTNGYQLADAINASAVKLMIDYEHQTMFIEQNGKPNPAAGWIERAEYLSGEGLFAEVNWVDEACEMIKTKAYRYLSPLFLTDSDGRVLKLINAALTNRPALHNLAEVVALSQSFLQKEGVTMLSLLQQLFGMPNATEAEIKAQLTALSASKENSTVALSDVYTKLKENDAQVVALNEKLAQGSVQNPDPTKFVALSEMKAVQDQLVSLQAQLTADKVEAVVTQALSDGKLLPAQKEWAVALGKKDLSALTDFVAASPTYTGLTETQAKATPDNNQTVALSDAEKAAAKMLGMSEEDYIAEHKQEKK